MDAMIKVLTSACLLGEPVRPKGRDVKSHHPVLARWIEEGRIVSACPEMLGGLGVPRPPAEISPSTGRVLTNEGDDVTAAFQEGARLVGALCEDQGIRVAILKANSPSCGTRIIYDGTFSGAKVAGDGVTAALLRANGVTLFDENQLDEAAEYVASLEGPAS
jgi:uncharacterized protein YbbK (DUF523 family)